MDISFNYSMKYGIDIWQNMSIVKYLVIFFKKSTSSRRGDLVPSGLWLFNEFGFGGRSELERQIKRSNTDRNQENKNIFPRKTKKLVP